MVTRREFVPFSPARFLGCAFEINSSRSVTSQKCVPPALALQMRKLSVRSKRADSEHSDVPPASALAELWADMRLAMRD